MHRREPWCATVYEPGMDTVIRIGWTVTVIAFLVTVVSIVGEVLGWWGFLGEVGATAGSTITVLVGLATLMAGAGRQQVEGVRGAVEANGAQLEKLDKLDKLDDLDRVQAELDAQTGVLDRQVEVLEQIRDGL